MSLAEWAGEYDEWAVHVSSDLFDYVADIRTSRELAEGAARQHGGPGVTVEVVRRTVHYGEWQRP